MVALHLAALIAPPTRRPTYGEALALCRDLARTHYENFPLVSWLVPRALRPHVTALYAYCRTVDDVGDEAPGDREGLLDRFEGELSLAYRGEARHPVLVALEPTIDRFELPQEPLWKLIQANRIDQTKHRYATFAELLEYCDHSANPVGRLFLHLFGLSRFYGFRLFENYYLFRSISNRQVADSNGDSAWNSLDRGNKSQLLSAYRQGAYAHRCWHVPKP